MDTREIINPQRLISCLLKALCNGANRVDGRKFPTYSQEPRLQPALTRRGRRVDCRSSRVLFEILITAEELRTASMGTGSSFSPALLV